MYISFVVFWRGLKVDAITIFKKNRKNSKPEKNFLTKIRMHDSK